MFMDEPTSGLDARAAATVMRAVKNVVNTGRTVVCTIHQPSIDIFESFDEGIPGIPKIDRKYNPATWMLDITSPSTEKKLGIDYAQLYKMSTLYRNDEQDMFNIIGSMFLPIVFFGLNNCTTIIPIVAAERAVMYREKYAGMYSSWAYSFAQVTIEIPYILLQAFIFVAIIYPTVGYCWSLYKIIWCFYTIFCSLLCSTYLGMFLMSLSPSTKIANILTAASYTLLNLFSGYLLPRPRLPKWWVWLYWVCPTSWSLTGVITSQYGDVTQVISVYGEPKPINTMIRDYYGFQQDEKLLVGVMLIVFPITFACLFAYTTGRLNFQKR